MVKLVERVPKQDNNLVYNPFNRELVSKLDQLSSVPETAEKNIEKWLLENKDKGLEYVEKLVILYMMQNEPFKAMDLTIEYLKKDEYGHKCLELLFVIHDQFSDNLNDPLAFMQILHKLDPESPQKLDKLLHLFKASGRHEEAVEYVEKFFKAGKIDNKVDQAIFYIFTGAKEGYEKGKELLKKVKTKDHKTEERSISLGAAKFYAGQNYEGLIYHFGGEDLRPREYLLKKAIPNSDKTDFNNKTVLITPYRGLGDSMILSRFIPLFIERWPDVKISILTEKPLIPLYQNINGVKDVKTSLQLIGRTFDYCLGVNMLSRYVKDIAVDKNEKIICPAWVNYPSSYDDKWSNVFKSNKPVVGVNWRGSQNLGGDKNYSRDVNLKQFKYLFDIFKNEFDFLYLNTDIKKEERDILSEYDNVYIARDLEKINNFGDTAALINLCDVVVSTDTSISTLSASMFKDTLVLAKHFPDYRWMHYEKWWDLEKTNIKVYKKKKPFEDFMHESDYDEQWFQPLLEVASELQKYKK